MDPRTERRKAEDALTSLRDHLRNVPDVLGSGITADGDHLAVLVITRRHVASLPDNIEGTAVIEEIRDVPGPWAGA